MYYKHVYKKVHFVLSYSILWTQHYVLSFVWVSESYLIGFFTQIPCKLSCLEFLQAVIISLAFGFIHLLYNTKLIYRSLCNLSTQYLVNFSITSRYYTYKGGKRSTTMLLTLSKYVWCVVTYKGLIPECHSIIQSVTKIHI